MFIIKVNEDKIWGQNVSKLLSWFNMYFRAVDSETWLVFRSLANPKTDGLGFSIVYGMELN